MRITTLLWVSGCWATADVADVRILSCTPEIADALRANLDQAKLSSPEFEKAYDRLITSKQIEELARVRKDDWTISPGRPQELEFTSVDWHLLHSPQGAVNGRRPINKTWEYQITLSAGRHESHIEYAWNKFLLPPGGMGVGLNDTELDGMTIFPLPVGSWQIIEETMFAGSMVVSLFRHSPTDAVSPGSTIRFYVAEGFFITTDGMEAERMATMNSEQLAVKIGDLRKAKKLTNFFRIRAGSNTRTRSIGGSFFRHRKGSMDNPFYDYKKRGTRETDTTLFGGQLHHGVDPKEVELDGNALLFRSSESNQIAEKHEFKFNRKMILGDWVAMTPVAKTGGPMGVFAFRIIDLAPPM